MNRDDWTGCGQGWQGVEEKLRLTNWTKKRRIIVLRREIKGEIAGKMENQERVECEQ